MRIYQAKGTIFHTMQTIMVPIGYLSGHQSHWEVARDERLKPFIQNVLHKEIVPSIHPFGDQGWTMRTIFRYEDLDTGNLLVEAPKSPSFQDWEMTLLTRFSNLVIPCVMGYYYEHHHARLPARLAFSMAALIRFYKDCNDQAMAGAFSDTMKWMRQLWSLEPQSLGQYEQLATWVVGNKALWKQDLNELSGLSKVVAYHLTCMHEAGFDAALQQVARV